MQVLLSATLTLLFAWAACAGESPVPETPPWPLWDGLESVAEYARRVNLPPTQTLDLGNGVKLELVLIPAGTFLMGTPQPNEPEETVVVGQGIAGAGGAAALALLAVILVAAIRRRQRPQISLRGLLALTFALGIGIYGGVRWWKTEQAWKEYALAVARFEAGSADEKPAHSVTLTKPFYLGQYEVTQEQYQQVMGANPSSFKGRTHPVENVSWDGAREFCKKLNERLLPASPDPSTLIPDSCRLPTEAEWEYACRAGTGTQYHSGDTDPDLDRVAWYDGNSKGTTHPVGEKEANRFGLYDMHGNSWEWCQDWYEESYYAKASTKDPPGPAQGANRVLRGGSWDNDPRYCRAAYRDGNIPDHWNYYFIGFRVVVAPSFRTP